MVDALDGVQGTEAGWKGLLKTGDFNPTAPTAASITVNADVEITQLVRPFDAIRVLDRTGIRMNDAAGQLQDFAFITTTAPVGFNDLVDSRGRLYFNVVDDTGGYWHVDVYNRPERAVGDLIAHTATYNSLGTKLLIADNASGIDPTAAITVNVLGPADVDIYVEFYKYFIAATPTTTTLSLVGPVLSTASGRIEGVWRGSSSKVTKLTWAVPGAFAAGASSSLLYTFANRAERSLLPPSRVCAVAAWVKTAGVTQVYVNMTYDGTAVLDVNSGNGIAVGTSWAEALGADLADEALVIEDGNDIELSCTAGDGSDANLVVEAILVQE
jgi:hypothetical protein